MRTETLSNQVKQLEAFMSQKDIAMKSLDFIDDNESALSERSTSCEKINSFVFIVSNRSNQSDILDLLPKNKTR